MINISTKAEYAIRALVRIALSADKQLVSIGNIAEKEKISKKYLENIFNLLKRSKIVQSTRGPVGGYRLARTPEELTIYDILDAVQGPLASPSCILDPLSCDRTSKCGSRKLWKEFQNHIDDFLKSKTLAQVMGYYKKERKVS
ncbi:MAG: transcriptional regulator [Spirochaetes bacterium]|nr:MAG: transcriptional regulator [Spirochaetota bacterium]